MKKIKYLKSSILFSVFFQVTSKTPQEENKNNKNTKKLSDEIYIIEGKNSKEINTTSLGDENINEKTKLVIIENAIIKEDISSGKYLIIFVNCKFPYSDKQFPNTSSIIINTDKNNNQLIFNKIPWDETWFNIFILFNNEYGSKKSFQINEVIFLECSFWYEHFEQGNDINKLLKESILSKIKKITLNQCKMSDDSNEGNMNTFFQKFCTKNNLVLAISTSQVIKKKIINNKKKSNGVDIDDLFRGNEDEENKTTKNNTDVLSLSKEEFKFALELKSDFIPEETRIALLDIFDSLKAKNPGPMNQDKKYDWWRDVLEMSLKIPNNPVIRKIPKNIIRELVTKIFRETFPTGLDNILENLIVIVYSGVEEGKVAFTKNLLVGPAGTGKTTISKVIAQILCLLVTKEEMFSSQFLQECLSNEEKFSKLMNYLFINHRNHMLHVSLNGAKDSLIVSGSAYTFVGAKPGGPLNAICGTGFGTALEEIKDIIHIAKKILNLKLNITSNEITPFLPTIYKHLYEIQLKKKNNVSTKNNDTHTTNKIRIMAPFVMLLDEVDKVEITHSNNSKAIHNALLNFFDDQPLQDAYFYYNLFFKKNCVWVLTANDETEVSSFLGNRLTTIRVETLTNEDRISIMNSYLTKKLIEKSVINNKKESFLTKKKINNKDVEVLMMKSGNNIITIDMEAIKFINKINEKNDGVRKILQFIDEMATKIKLQHSETIAKNMPLNIHIDLSNIEDYITLDEIVSYENENTQKYLLYVYETDDGNTCVEDIRILLGQKSAYHFNIHINGANTSEKSTMFNDLSLFLSVRLQHISEAAPNSKYGLTIVDRAPLNNFILIQIPTNCNKTEYQKYIVTQLIIATIAKVRNLNIVDGAVVIGEILENGAFVPGAIRFKQRLIALTRSPQVKVIVLPMSLKTNKNLQSLIKKFGLQDKVKYANNLDAVLSFTVELDTPTQR